jgi:para-nitrobenzyl esterase
VEGKVLIVETKYGKIDGITENGCNIYKGIPYAKPPVGRLRFAKPQKPEKWQGVLMADHAGNMAMQRKQIKGSFYQKEFYNNPDFTVAMSDDCLYLNIWKPSECRDSNLPVAIYIHGGAFMSGAGSNLPFEASALAKKGVIIVTINYRVGVWGFLSHPILEKKNHEATSGNYGLWDQIEALNWVRENISAFGGNPDNITLFGQSAGAMSLQILALSPITEGLYQKMILQSGGGYKNPLAEFRTMEKAQMFAQWFFDELGIDIEDENMIDKLETLPAQEIQDAAEAAVGKSFQNKAGIPFVPVIDGEILRDNGDNLIENKLFHKTPYILGANANDITMENASDFSQENNPMQMSNIAFAKLGNDAGADCYVYYFTRQLPGDESGAFHSAELWYVFGSLDYCWRKDEMQKEDWILSDEIMTYWSNFMKSGNPNQDGMEAWEKCTMDRPFVKVF